MKFATMMYLCLPNFNEDVLMIDKVERDNDPNSGLHTLSGGKLKGDEKGGFPKGRVDCGVRETFEETGARVLDAKLRGIILFDNSEREFKRWKDPQDFVVYIIAGTRYEGELLPKTDEGIPLWVPRRKIYQVPKNPGDNHMYKWLETGKNFIGMIKVVGEKLDEQGTWVDYF